MQSPNSSTKQPLGIAPIFGGGEPIVSEFDNH